MTFRHRKLFDWLQCVQKVARPVATTTVAQQQGRGQMLVHQKSLPRLPVPPLQRSLEKYLLSTQPLLTDEEYVQTQRVVKEFGMPGGLGEKLHSMLQQRAEQTDNWLTDWWLSSAYLAFRMPVVIYSSPGLVFPLQEFNAKEDQLRYAAKLVTGALEYKMLIDRHYLPTDMMGMQPLDMEQYLKIFSTCRIPAIPTDKLKFYGDQQDPPRHIIVIHNNHFFAVDMYGSDGAPLNESQILAQLQTVVEQSQFPKSPIGILSSGQRDKWAKAYKHLCKDKINKQSVEVIQRGMFVLALDKPMTNVDVPDRRTRAALQMVHGGGSKGNSGNRWFDKTIQFVVSEDGLVGLTYEHSPAEGPPIASLMDFIVNYMEKTKGNRWLPSTNVMPPERLRFNLSQDTMADIEEAEKELDILVEDLEMSCLVYPVYGRDYIKTQKLSPDSFIQMAIQLAFFRLHGQLAATYESASVRKFIQGRTETIRSASVEAQSFCKGMLDPKWKPDQKAAALRSAIDAHKAYASQAVNGMGVDRLLLGMKLLAVEKGMNVPELFLDAGFTTSTHFRLSTSQVPSKCDAFMCYGPLVPNGYGCCYNPLPRSIVFGIAACNSSPETSSPNFKAALEECLTDMHNVLQLSQPSKL